MHDTHLLAKEHMVQAGMAEQFMHLDMMPTIIYMSTYAVDESGTVAGTAHMADVVYAAVYAIGLRTCHTAATQVVDWVRCVAALVAVAIVRAVLAAYYIAYHTLLTTQLHC